jgi:hypothetical protein
LDLLHATCAYAIGKTESAKESLNEYLTENPKNTEPSAIYLARLLQVDSIKSESGVKRESDSAKYSQEVNSGDPVIQYFNGVADRKAVLNWAGIAKSPEKAQQQICVAAFWMAQWKKTYKDAAKAKELLKIAVDIGSPDLTEWQLANWQWSKK